MTDKELMQQALDALEEINKLSIGENAICLPAEIDGALDALRERLAQPEQEPVIKWDASAPLVVHPHPAFQAAPLQRKPEQEPVFDCPRCGHCCPPQGIYYTPPQRKPLTDEEIYDMYNEPRSDAEMIAFARAIEAAHGIKGEA